MISQVQEAGIDFEAALRTATIWGNDLWLPPWPNAEPETFRNIARALLALNAELIDKHAAGTLTASQSEGV